MAKAPEWHIERALQPIFRYCDEKIFDEFARAGYTDLRPGHQNVLIFIDDEGTGVSELARRAGISKQAMVHFVNELEDGGYVERIPNPRDGRGRLVRTTDKGERHFEAAWRAIDRIEKEWEGVLGPRRMREFRTALRAIGQHAEAMRVKRREERTQ